MYKRQDVGLGHLLHGQGRLHPHRHPLLLQAVGQGQGVDDGGQHPHVVGPGALHLAAGAAPPEVAAAHDDGHLAAQFGAHLDVFADVGDDVVVDPHLFIACQRLAGQL